MLGATAKVVVPTLMILNGLFFMCNIYVVGNREAIIGMHADLAPGAGAFVANAKVIVVFVTGVLYLISAIGIMRKRYSLALAGILGSALCDGSYIVQLIMWAKIHPRIWIHFWIFGGLGLIYGIYSWLNWKKRRAA